MKKAFIYIMLCTAFAACKKNKPPTIEIKSPTDGGAYSVGSTFTIRALLADDEGLKEVKYTIFGKDTKLQLTGTSFLMEADQLMKDMDSSLKIELTDNDGEITTSEIKIYKK